MASLGQVVRAADLRSQAETLDLFLTDPPD
jgi:hypothetical protein